MTRRERVKAALRHEQTARTPFNICPDVEMRKKLRAHLGRPPEGEELSLGRLDLNDLFFDNDVEMIHIPWWTWNLGPDWRQPERPRSGARVKGTGNYVTFYDALKAYRQSSDRYVLAMVYGSHVEKAQSARGFECFMADLGEDYDFARTLLRRIVDRNMVMLENILSCEGIDGVLLGSDWGSQQGLLMSLAMWDDLIRPGEQREYDLIHSCGKDVWIHSCGKVDRLIPRLIEMGADVLNPLQPECMDIAAIKAEFGARIAFWGGVSTQRLLPFGTPEEVRREARAVKAMMRRNGGYIFAASQEIQADVPIENLRALLEVARETDDGREKRA